MKLFKLDQMVKGWFVGNFEPTVLKTNEVEVAVKKYTNGSSEVAHYHKVAKEITVVLSGKVRMFGQEYSSGDIIAIEPGEVTDFLALTDVVTVVVKLPGANNDKYMAEKAPC